MAQVDVAPLRARMEELHAQGVSYSTVARRLNWFCTRANYPTTPDTSRLKRALGLQRWTCGHGYEGTVRTIAGRSALRLADALGLDPVDIGL